jgi:glucokinase
MSANTGTHGGSGLALVADVGGTNARFALAEIRPSGPPCPLAPVRFEVARFPTFADAVAEYLRNAGAKPTRALLAVAGPVAGDTVRITNSPWRVDAQALRAQFGFASIRLINDFAAMSAAVPQLTAADLCPLGAPAAPDLQDGAPRVLGVIGPGTGLGVGLLLMQQQRTLIVETEGGHVAFGPANDEEVAVLGVMLRRFGRVSNERLMCGSGLVNLHAALAEIAGVPTTLSTPEAIVDAAHDGRSPLALRAVELMCELLGGVAGDLALMTGAWDGIYLAGGLVQPLLPWLRSGRFRKRFEAKGRRSVEMARVPTLAITHGDAGLLGAAAWAVEGLVVSARRGG